MVNKVLEKTWTYLIVDFITKLLLVAGKNVILVVCDWLSKMVHFVVTTEEILVKRLARLFRDNVQKLHRLLENVILDRGPYLAAGLMKELNEMLGTETKLLMAFHLQIDRQTETTNQELEQYLRMYIDHRQSNWLEWLATVEFAFKNKVHIATKSSLFKVTME